MRPLVLALIVFGCFEAGADSRPARNDHAADLLQLTARVAAALGADDPSALAALLASDVPAKAGFLRDFGDILRVRCLTVEGPVTERVDVSGDEATIDLHLLVHKVEKPASSYRFPPEIWNLRLVCVRRGDGWRLREVRHREDLLAEEVAAAPAAAREDLIAAHPSLMTPRLVRAIYRRGLAFTNSDTLAEAPLLAATALALARDLGDTGGESLSLGLQGIAARMNGDLELAEEKTIIGAALAESDGDPDVLARAWLNTFRVAELRDQLSSSVESQQDRAYAYATRAEDRTLLWRVLDSRSSRAMTEGRNRDARAQLEELIRVTEGTGDPAHISALGNLAMLYREQGDFELALAENGRALTLARASHSYFVDFERLMIGILYVDLGRLDEAETMLQRELTLPQDGESLPQVYFALARLQAKRGDLDAAECLTRLGDFFYKKRGYREGVELAGPAELALQQGDVRRALRLALESAASDPDLPVRRTRIQALTVAGRAYRRLGMPAAAEACLLEAIEIHDDAFACTAGRNAQQVQVAEQGAAAYRELVGLLIETGRTREALVYGEHGKGRVVLNAMDGRRASSEGMLTPAELAEAARLEARIEALNRSLAWEWRHGNSTAATTDTRRELGAARLELDALRALHTGPSDGRETLEASPDVLRLLEQLRPDEAIVEYVTGDRAVVAMVARRGHDGAPRITSHSLPVERAVLSKGVDRLLRAVASRDLDAAAASSSLYDLLLAPVAPELRGIRTLCIVPDGELWDVPFIALEKGGASVLSGIALAYAPSIAVHFAMRDRAPAGSASTALLALGNPTLGERAIARARSRNRDQSLGDLPHAASEVNALRRLYPDAAVFTGSRATESIAKAEAPRHAILHFATHGVLDDRNPMDSRLMLAPDREQDGFLEASEIAEMRLNADVVVLSACETARGSAHWGEGVIGMTWAFLVAGAHATVASKWNVDSASTELLMVNFHAELTRGAAPAEALRRATLAVRRDPRYRHPYYWAAFVLIGGR